MQAVLPRSAQAKYRARHSGKPPIPIPLYFIVLQQTSFLYFLIWCIAFTMPLLCSIVHHSAGSNAERLWNDRRLFVGVVEERSATVAVMTLSVVQIISGTLEAIFDQIECRFFCCKKHLPYMSGKGKLIFLVLKLIFQCAACRKIGWKYEKIGRK